MRQLELNGAVIHDDSDCYVIAEIGNNHQGEVEKCKQLFLAAKEAGADAVKLQKRDNRSLFTKSTYERPYMSENAFGATYGAHRDFLEFGRGEYVELREFAKEIGMTFFATAFDIPSADFLEELDMPAYKIASGDVRSLPLLRHVASFGKPMIISTGGATLEDVRRAYEAIKPINDKLAILQCTASYPCEPDRLNLRIIENFRREFPDVVIGISDHYNGIAMPLVAYMFGAKIVEKHLTLNRAWKGTDHAFSLTSNGFRRMVRDLKRARTAIGDGVKRVLPEEEAPINKMSKALVASRNLPAGHVVTQDDIAMKSPGDGLPPYQINTLIGSVLVVAMQEDEPFKMECLATPKSDGVERFRESVVSVAGTAR